jgi:hypothetical protein
MMRKFKFLNYISDITNANKHGESSSYRLMKAIITNKLVPVELRKLYYFYSKLTTTGRSDTVEEEIYNSAIEILKKQGMDENMAKEVSKQIKAKLKTLNLKEVGASFKQQVNTYLSNPTISPEQKAQFLNKFAGALSPQEMKNFTDEYLTDMEFEVHSTSGNFNKRYHVYHFKSKTLDLYINGEWDDLGVRKYTYPNVSLNLINRAMTASSFGKEIFWTSLQK